ncbi:MAG: hypothetical protein IT320_20160 [Anaerolineae bacterium]|nr:hypothetical protein [Anaerolineae bacterium]
MIPYLPNRTEEIRQLLQLTPAEIRARVGKRLAVHIDLDTLHTAMAAEICDEIATRNLEDQPTRLILPVGPVGQYGPLLTMITEREVSLADCWLFFMDEYCDAEGRALPPDHPLSFRRIARDLFLSRLPARAGLDPARVFFPDEDNVDQLAGIIEQVGGIDTCYGGIGIHGHVAFNEPQPNVLQTSVRRADINDFTVTINAVRAGIGGNLAAFPRAAYTLGMRQIVNARRVRLYCRNGYGLDWANTILRLAVLGQPGDDFPVTHLTTHPDFVVTTDEDTLRSPKYVI